MKRMCIKNYVKYGGIAVEFGPCALDLSLANNNLLTGRYPWVSYCGV